MKNIKKITNLLIKKKVAGLLPAVDIHIFPISPTSKGKLLEPKDYVEIALRYCLLNE